LSELGFSTSLITLIVSFFTDRKLEVFIEGEFSTPRKIAAGVHKGSVLAPVLYRLYINDTDAALGTQLALFADDAFIYVTEKHERCVLCRLQHGLTTGNSWFARWNIKINDGKTRAIYFSRRLKESLKTCYN
jgi:hypothetical protein